MSMLNEMVIQRKAMSLDEFIDKHQEKAKPKFFKFYDEVDKEIAEEGES